MTDKAFVETVPDQVNAKSWSFNKTHYTDVICNYTLLNAGGHEQVANRANLHRTEASETSLGPGARLSRVPSHAPSWLRNRRMGEGVGIAFPHRFLQSRKLCHVCHSPWRNCMLAPELNTTAPGTKAEESLWCEEPHSQETCACA